MSRISAWLQLVRISATPTAWSNALAGYFFVGGSFAPLTPLLIFLLGVTAIYWAGMVLNDWADSAVDRIERPKRPIPRGAIGQMAAGSAGFALLLTGCSVVIAAAVAASSRDSIESIWIPMVFATLLAAAIVSYDLWLKHQWCGPWIMGSCRSLLFLLAFSVASMAASSPGIRSTQVLLAVWVGVYISGVTSLSRREVQGSHRRGLVGAVSIMGISIGGFCLLPAWDALTSEECFPAATRLIYSLFLVISACPVIWRLLRVLGNPTPGRIQATVASSLFTLIAFDGVLCFSVGGARWPLLIPFAALLLVGAAMRRFFSPT